MNKIIERLFPILIITISIFLFMELIQIYMAQQQTWGNFLNFTITDLLETAGILATAYYAKKIGRRQNTLLEIEQKPLINVCLEINYSASEGGFHLKPSFKNVGRTTITNLHFFGYIIKYWHSTKNIILEPPENAYDDHFFNELYPNSEATIFNISLPENGIPKDINNGDRTILFFKVEYKTQLKEEKTEFLAYHLILYKARSEAKPLLISDYNQIRELFKNKLQSRVMKNPLHTKHINAIIDRLDKKT